MKAKSPTVDLSCVNKDDHLSVAKDGKDEKHPLHNTLLERGLVSIMKDRQGKSEPLFLCHLHNELDINRARYLLKSFASELIIQNQHLVDHSVTSTNTIALTRLLTACNELCWNAVKYAGGGVLALWIEVTQQMITLTLQIADEGPGIEDLEWAFHDHNSSGGTLGLGLSGTKRLVDWLNIESPIQGLGYGTLITVQSQWRRT